MRIQKLKKAIAVALAAACLGTNPAFAAVNTYAKLGDNVVITAEFKDTSLTDTLDALSKLSNIPIVINGTLSSNKVTLNANGQTLSTILNNLAQAFSLSYIEQDGMIVVSTKDVMTTTQTFKLKYLDLEEVRRDLKTFVDDDKVSISAIDNSITISGSAADIARAREIIRLKDVQQKQVTIQAKLIELDSDDIKKLGFNHSWSSIHSTDDTGWSFKWTTILNADEAESTGKVLARPTVSAMNGKEAKISITDRVPILTTTTSNNDRTTTVEYQEVGVILKTTPRINEETGYVTLELNPSVSTITGYVTNENVNAPKTANREVNTTLRVRSGETIVIGGLLKTDDLMALTKIPILGDLPIFGKLLFQFKNHEKRETELVVMITPIIEGSDEYRYREHEKRTHTIHDDESMDRVEHLDRRGRDDRSEDTVAPKEVFGGDPDTHYGHTKPDYDGYYGYGVEDSEPTEADIDAARRQRQAGRALAQEREENRPETNSRDQKLIEKYRKEIAAYDKKHKK